jgi:capsular exopolysaccharide synthesis family protein
METQTFSDDLRRYLALAWHWAWLLILATLLSAVAAYLVSKRMTPVYEATTTLLISQATNNQTTDYNSVLTSERLASTYAEMMTKRPVLEAVIQKLSLPVDVVELGKAVSVQPVNNTQLIDVKVEDTSPARAADTANALYTVFSEQNQALQSSRFASSKDSLSSQLAQMDQQIQDTNAKLAALGTTSADQAERDRLETALAQYRQTYASLLQSFETVRVAEAQATSNVVQVEPAVPPEKPVRPRTLVNTALAGIVGLMLAVGVVFLIEALDDTLNPDSVARQLGLPVLGLIARHDSEDGSPVVAGQPRSPVAEAFRSLRTNIQFASVDRELHTLLITSPSPSDGKSTVVANLGAALAQSGRKVAVVEADLRRPVVHKKLGLPNLQGMSALFVQPKISLNGALQETGIQNLCALTSGDIPPNPAELLGSEKMSEILRQVGTQVDIIVMDTPPVMAVTDATVLSTRVDGVLLVVKPGTTKLAAARQAVEQLQRVGANVLGVVLNEIDLGHSRYGYYRYKGYYAYQDYYGQDGRKSSRKKPHKDADSAASAEPEKGQI